jgi:hypothetical protein
VRRSGHPVISLVSCIKSLRVNKNKNAREQRRPGCARPSVTSAVERKPKTHVVRVGSFSHLCLCGRVGGRKRCLGATRESGLGLGLGPTRPDPARIHETPQAVKPCSSRRRRRRRCRLVATPPPCRLQPRPQSRPSGFQVRPCFHRVITPGTPSTPSSRSAAVA